MSYHVICHVSCHVMSCVCLAAPVAGPGGEAVELPALPRDGDSHVSCHVVSYVMYHVMSCPVCVWQHLWPDLEEKLWSALLSLEMELRKAAEIAGLTHIAQALEEVGGLLLLLFIEGLI